MTTLYLKYGSYVDGALTWEMYGQSFSPLKFIRTRQSTTESGRALSEIEYSHQKSKRYTWQVVISANDLSNTTKFAYLESFFTAGAWKFSTDNWSSSTEVTLKESGDMPVDFIKGHKSLPSVKLTLIQKEPD